MTGKSGFPHYMLKEIFDQPKALEDTIASRVSLVDAEVRIADEIRIPADELRALRRINIVASGTSRHAGMAGADLFFVLVVLHVGGVEREGILFNNTIIVGGG